MLKKFSLRNYKNFKEDISIDFHDIAGYQFSADCIANGLISKMLIYGRNATGKTNLGKALMDIAYTMFGGLRHMDEGTFLNADAAEDYAFFSYTFQFDEHEVVYQYTKLSNIELRDEELVIDRNTIYKCDFLLGVYNFDKLSYVDAEIVNIERYIQYLDEKENTEEIPDSQLPFLRWLVSNAALKSDSVLLRLSDYVRRMAMMTVSQNMRYRPRRMMDVFFESLENGSALEAFENFLNTMGIRCRLVLQKLPDGQSELYFDHDKLVPFFENASSGTLALVDLYRRFLTIGKNPSFLYFDEFDVFYHYEMAENVINFFKEKYPACQIIMTSHNTNLMTNRLMRPDCLFILSVRGTLTALCNATLRELREGHNLEKMYISGEFERYE